MDELTHLGLLEVRSSDILGIPGFKHPDNHSNLIPVLWPGSASDSSKHLFCLGMFPTLVHIPSIVLIYPLLVV